MHTAPCHSPLPCQPPGLAHPGRASRAARWKEGGGAQAALRSMTKSEGAGEDVAGTSGAETLSLSWCLANAYVPQSRPSAGDGAGDGDAELNRRRKVYAKHLVDSLWRAAGLQPRLLGSKRDAYLAEQAAIEAAARKVREREQEQQRLAANRRKRQARQARERAAQAEAAAGRTPDALRKDAIKRFLAGEESARKAKPASEDAGAPSTPEAPRKEGSPKSRGDKTHAARGSGSGASTGAPSKGSKGSKAGAKTKAKDRPTRSPKRPAGQAGTTAGGRETRASSGGPQPHSRATG